MSLLAAYVSAAATYGEALKSGDHKAANSSFGRIHELLAKLRLNSDRGKVALGEILSASDNPHVRCSAATHLLPLDESSAMDVLETVSLEEGIVGFHAKMVIREWNAGRLKIP